MPYINIKMASHLAEDIYTKKDFRDWNSSKWCWENPKYFEKDGERKDINVKCIYERSKSHWQS